jgi:hypothetical protein
MNVRATSLPAVLYVCSRLVNSDHARVGLRAMRVGGRVVLHVAPDEDCSLGMNWRKE